MGFWCVRLKMMLELYKYACQRQIYPFFVIIIALISYQIFSMGVCMRVCIQCHMEKQSLQGKNVNRCFFAFILFIERCIQKAEGKNAAVIDNDISNMNIIYEIKFQPPPQKGIMKFMLMTVCHNQKFSTKKFSIQSS